MANPVVDLNGAGAGSDATASFTEQTPLVIVPVATITDVDSPNLASLTVTLTTRPDGDGVESLSLNAAAAALAATLTVTYTAATGVLSITGSALPADYQSILEGVVYNNTSDTPTTTDRTVSVVVVDDTAGSSTLQNVTIGITAVNDEPTLTATPTNPVFAEGAAAVALFTGSAASTIEAGQTITSLTLTVSNVTDGANEILFFDGSDVALTNGNTVVGTATNTLTVNVTVAANVATVTFSGATLSEAQVQTLVDALTYRNTSQDPTDANRVVTITQLVDSGANGGSDDNTSNPGVASTVNVNPVNDAPVLDAAKTPVLNAENEDAVAPVGAVGTLVSNLVNLNLPAGGLDNVTDPDSANIGIALTGTAGGGTWFYTIDGGTNWTAVGVVADASARLLAADANTRLYYQPATNINGTISNAITFRAWDTTSGANGDSAVDTSGANSGGTTAFSAVADTADITINAVNDAPVLDATKTPVLSAENEDAGAPVGAVGTLVSNLVNLDPPAGGLDNVADVDAGAVTGIALTATAGGGTWFFTIDGGTNWTAVGVVADASARLLAADANTRLYYQPATNINGTISNAITFRAWDTTSGANGDSAVDTSGANSGGTTAFSAVADTADITINAVNDAPVLDAAKTPVLNAENEDAVAPVGAVGTLVSNLVNLDPPSGGLDNVTDPDSANIGIALTATTGGGTWFYSLNNGTNWLAVGAVTDASARLLAADASTRLYYQPAANANGTETITFRAWDRLTGANGDSGVNVSGANNGGSTAFSAVSDTANLTITAVNDGPTNTVPVGPLAAQEDTNLSITGISVTDIDAAPQHVSVTLSVLHGSLDVRTDVAGGVDAANVSGDTTGSVTLTGTPTEINTTLGAANGLVYRGNLNFSGSGVNGDTLTVNTNDLGHTGTGGPLSDSDPIAINVAAVVANTLSATQTTTLATDNDGDGVIDPGDHVTVTVKIANNSTTTAATGVSFNETLSGLTQNGAVHVTPITFDDSFTGVVHNTPIELNVLANDIDPNSSTPLSNVGLGIASIDTTGTVGTAVINTHGTGTTADDTITFTPVTGSIDYTTTFKYFTTDAEGLTSNEAATVTVQVNGGTVWYVDANASSVGQDGSFAHAFTSLTQLNGVTGDGTTNDDVDGAGDTIFVYSDTTTPITYTGGIVLEGSQKLLGDGVAFSVNGLTIGHATDDAAHAPTIISTAAGANDITLGSGNTLRGFTLGNTNGGVALSGTNFGTLTVDNVAINTNNTAISLNTGAFAAGASFSSVSVSTAGITDVSLTGVSGTVDLGSGTMNGQFAVSGGSVNTTYSGNITQSGAGALVNVINGHTGTLTFQTGTLSATNGTGLQFNNADGTYNFNGTTTLNGGDAGIDILAGSAGTFNFSSNTSITNPSGVAFNADASSANVNYNGTISKTGSASAVVANANTGGTLDFNGLVTANTGTATAINLTTNTNATIQFDGGLNIDTTTGTGFVATGGGTVRVSATAGDESINSTSGQALNLSGVAIGASGLGFDSTSSGGGINNVKIASVSGGAIALGSGTLAGASGAAFLVGDGAGTANTGGTSAITYAGTITTTGTARAVDIEDRAAGAGNITLSGTISHTGGNASTIFLDQNVAGTINFSGANSVANSGTADAIHLTNNTGAIINFTGGGLNIDTTSGAGFLATGGGTVSVTGTSNFIDTGTGTGLNVANTTIGASGLTFQHISSNGAASGIILNTTGTSGGLTVTGDGTAANNGSGGVIQATTGDGISLTSTMDVHLAQMNIQNNLGDGIGGSTINGFVLNRMNISGNGNDAATDESGINVTQLTGTASNGLHPTSISNSTISNNNEFEIQITNSSGTLTNFQLLNNAISSNGLPINGNVSSPHGNLVNFLGHGTAIMGLTVNGGSFTGNWNAASPPATITGTGVHADTDASAAGIEMTVNVTGAAFTNNNAGVNVSSGPANTDIVFDLENNTFTGQRSTAINIFGNGNSPFVRTMNGTIQGNTIGTNGVAASGSLVGAGIDIGNESAANMNLLINNNILQSFGTGPGLGVTAIIVNLGLGGQATGGGTTNVTITNNTIRDVLNGRGITIQDNQDSGFGPFPTIFANVAGNTFLGTIAGQAGNGTFMRIRELSGTVNVTQGTPTAANTATELDNANNSTDPTKFTISGAVAFNQGTPPLPTTNPLPLMAASGGVEAAQWNLIGTANFSGDGSNDQLWLGQDGLLRTDIFNADGALTNWYILGQLQTGWNVIGTANFNRDAISDLLLQNNNGAFQAALIQDNAIAATVDLQVVDGALVPARASDAPASDPAPADPAPAATGGSSIVNAPPAPTATGAVESHLTQTELDSIVSEAIARWEATGLTAEQSAYLQHVTFSISDMANLYLASATPGHITVDGDAAGYGWYLDATPADDVEFANTFGATRLQTDPSQLPAGHIDLLSTVMHELGHQLGLEDSYDLTDRDDLMYGYLVTGERRLPGEHEADDATPGSIDHEAFAVGPVSLGTLPAGRTVTITFDATVDAQTNTLITNPSNIGAVTSSFPAVNTNTNVTTLDSLTLGDLIFNDVNGNGVFDSGLGETGIDGVALTLFVDTNNSGGLDGGDALLATATTAGGGLYSFIGLAPGNYIVGVNQSNFTGGGALVAIPNSSPGNPDPDTDSDDNDDNSGVLSVSGMGAASLAITLAYNTEPTAGTGNDTNNTLDMGFLSIPPNAAPVVTAGSTVGFSETGGGLAVTLEPALTADDPDGTDLDGATVTITDFVAGDVLAFTPGFGITGGFAGGVLTLTGTASETDYQTVLRTVTYRSTSDNPDTFGTDTSRTISWTVNDGTQDSVAASTTVNITAENDAPALANVAPGALYVPGGPLVTLSSGATVSDVDDTNLESATVTVSDFVAGDELSVNGVLNSGAPVNGISWTYNGAGLLTLTGHSLLANYQSLLDQVQYRSTAGDPTVAGTDAQRTIQWVINDGDVGSTAATTTITIDAAPVLDLNEDDGPGSNNFTTTFTEDTGLGATPVSIASADTLGASVTDTDDTNMEGATITLTNPKTGDTLDVSGTLPGGITVFSQTASQIVLTGTATKADYALAIELITFTNSSQNPDTTPRIINSVVNDGDTNSNIAVTTIQVDSVNDDPVNTVPGAQVTNEDTNVVFSTANSNAITIADVDGGTNNETVTLSVAHGTLTYSALVGGATLSGGANGSLTFTLTGSTADLTATLNGLSYAPTADYNGADQLQVVTNDNGNTGTGGALTDTDFVDITINAVADVVDDNLTTNEDNAITANVLTGTNGASADNFENGGRAVTAVTQGSHGLVSFFANGDVTYTPNADFNGADTFTYTVTSGGVTETGTVHVSINAVNDAPVLNAAATPVLTAENEDAGVPVGAVGTLVSSLIDLNPPAGGNDNVTDVDASPVTGIALTATAGGGIWHYSINGGVTWNAVGVVSDSSARLLAADASTRLYYQPATDVFGTISGAITFRAWDQSAGTNGQGGINTVPNGGITPFSLATDTADITINSINDSPVFAGLDATPSFIENGSSVVLDNNATVSDVELDAAPSYDGAQLTLVRHTGANADDVFGGTGSLDLSSGSDVDLGGVIVGTFSAPGDGTFAITFNANATATDVDSVLQQLIYSNTGENPPASLVIDYTFSDGNGVVGGQFQGGGPTPGIGVGSITVGITQINDAPTVSNVAVAAAFTLGSAGVAVSPGISVFDPDATPPSPLTGLANATVKIQTGFFAGDQLFVNLPTTGGFFIVDDGGGPVVTNISVLSNVLGQMVLSGNDTVPHYQAVLNAASYRSTAADPSNGGANPTRGITWQVNDGALNSQTPDPDPNNLVNATVLHFNAPPTLDLDASGAGTGFTTTFTERDAPIPIVDTDVLITDPDNTTLSSATIVLTNAKPADVMSIAGALPGGIDSTIDTSVPGQITIHLTNSASLAEYQTALGQIRFSNTSVIPDETNRDITVVVNDGDGNSNVTHATVHVDDLPSNNADFNADGTNDVLWRHTNGFVAEWLMSGGAISQNLGVAQPDPTWHFQDTGDFGADGKSDVLWRHDNGQVVLWQMDGATIVSNQSVATIGNDWHNEGVADFGGDGKADVLWHNDSGQVALWTMNGAQITNNQQVANLGAGWHFQGLLDTGGDGKSDVLLRHDSGQVVLWTMNGAQITANQSVANNLGLDWNIVGTGDFGGDGKGDVLLRNDSGQVVIWQMNGSQIVSNQSVATPGNDWEVQDVADYNGDGRSDILWRNVSGQVVVWEMNGNQIVSNHTVTYQGGAPAPIGLEWTVQNHHYDLL